MEPETLTICKYGAEVLKVKAREIRDITQQVVDLALERTHRQGGELEMVRSKRARDLLAQHAPIAARLRF